MKTQQITSDTTNDLICLIHHALQSVDSFSALLRDAEDSGETELAEMLWGAIQTQRILSDRAKELLARRLSQDHYLTVVPMAKRVIRAESSERFCLVREGSELPGW